MKTWILRNYRKSLIIVLLLTTAFAKQKTMQQDSLSAYIARMEQQPVVPISGSPGSLWQDGGRLAYLTGDFKASRIGDLITIVILDDMQANNANTVSTNRTFSASSGISALAGKLKTTGVQELFSPNSSQTLSGKSQAATTSTLQATISGRVVAVLTSGLLVIEAERQLTMNNEKQTIVLRGLVRTGDIAPNNSVASNNVANLELQLKGKGVLSDGTHPPNPVVRGLLRILGF